MYGFYQKLAGSVSTNRYPDLAPIREENLKVPGERSSKPPSGGSKGVYNVQPSQYGNTQKSGSSTDNDVELSISSETSTPGPTGVSGSPDAQIHQGLRHAHASVYDTRSNDKGSVPAVNKATNGQEAVDMLDNRAQDNNYANTGQYGDKTTMNTVDFQTNSKVDKLTVLSRKLDKMLDKTANYHFDPSEGHFERILRNKGIDALEAGDKEGAVKCAVALNALKFLEGKLYDDKTAAAAPAASSAPTAPASATAPQVHDQLLLDTIKDKLDQWQQSSPKSYEAARLGINPLLGAGVGLGISAWAGDGTKGNKNTYWGRLRNKFGKNRLRTALGAALVAPEIGALFTQGKDPEIPKGADWRAHLPVAARSLAAATGAGLLLSNAFTADTDQGADSEVSEYMGATNRTVPPTMLRNTVAGGALGGTGGFGATLLADKALGLGLGIDDYAKYTLGGAALGAGLGAMYTPLAVNYNKSVNYLK